MIPVQITDLNGYTEDDLPANDLQEVKSAL